MHIYMHILKLRSAPIIFFLFTYYDARIDATHAHYGSFCSYDIIAHARQSHRIRHLHFAILFCVSFSKWPIVLYRRLKLNIITIKYMLECGRQIVRAKSCQLSLT